MSDVKAPASLVEQFFFVKIKNAAPKRINNVDVSPTEPGIKPINLSQVE